MVFRLPLALAIWVMVVRVACAAAPAPVSPVATAPDDATAAQIDAWLADGDAAEPGVPEAASGDGDPARLPPATHGQASVTLGSGGYRAASVSALMPLGDAGTLGVAVADERSGGRRRGDRRTLAVSLNLGTGASPEPCGVRHTGPQLLSDSARSKRCGGLGR